MSNHLLAALCACVFAAPSAADIIVIESDRDNTIYELVGGAQSNGAGTNMYTGSDLIGDRRRALVHFNLEAIPRGATIQHVTLLLTTQHPALGAETVELHRVIRDWGEAGSMAMGSLQAAGALAMPGDATWEEAFHGGELWTNPGGDSLPIPSATVSVLGLGTYGWSSTLVLQDVCGWHREAGTNFGWMLMHQDEDTTDSLRGFHTRESAEVSSRPRLVVEYLPPICGTEYFCEAAPNSTGQPALMAWSGTCVVSDADFQLQASPVPNEPGIFFYSAGRANGGLGVPFGNGLRCVGGPLDPIQRMGASTASNGVLSWSVELTSPPAASGQITAGTTWHFQGWFRDPGQGPAFFDLSDGLSVTFE